jgi:hypothetical protein
VTGVPADLLDRAAAVTRDAGVTPQEMGWATACVMRHARDWQSRNELLDMLGLAGEPVARAFDVAARRAVPDSFRRGRPRGKG